MRELLLKMYNAVVCYSNSKCAIYVLSLVSFTESCVFIIPPDVLLVPLALANPKKAFYYAVVAGFFSVLGGIFAYTICYHFYEYIGATVIDYFNYQEQIKILAEYYNKYNFLVIFLAGFTPFPYKLIALFSGFIQNNFFVFTLASVVSRFGRFFLITGIIYYFKEDAKLIVKNYFSTISILFSILIVLIVAFYLL